MSQLFLRYMNRSYCLFNFERDINRDEFISVVSELVDGEVFFKEINKGYIAFYGEYEALLNLHPILINDFQVGITMMISPIINELAFKLLEAQKYYFNNEIRFISEIAFFAHEEEEIKNLMKKQFDHIDVELINTAKAFISCGLNALLTAKKMYLHRNTFNYRLNKLLKESGIDIRDYHNSKFFEMCLLIKRI